MQFKHKEHQMNTRNTKPGRMQPLERALAQKLGKEHTVGMKRDRILIEVGALIQEREDLIAALEVAIAKARGGMKRES